MCVCLGKYFLLFLLYIRTNIIGIYCLLLKKLIYMQYMYIFNNPSAHMYDMDEGIKFLFYIRIYNKNLTFIKFGNNKSIYYKWFILYYIILYQRVSIFYNIW